MAAFFEGMVGICAWAVLFVAGGMAVILAFAGSPGAIVAGVIAWGAWRVLQRLVETE